MSRTPGQDEFHRHVRWAVAITVGIVALLIGAAFVVGWYSQ